MAKPPEQSLDARILEILGANGRVTNIEVARQLGLSEATVRQRIKKLVDSEMIAFKAIVDLPVVGFNVVAILRLAVVPARLFDVVESLRHESVVPYLARTFGAWNLIAMLEARSNAELSADIERLVGSRKDVTRFDCRMITRAIKFDTRYAPVRGMTDVIFSVQREPESPAENSAEKPDLA